MNLQALYELQVKEIGFGTLIKRLAELESDFMLTRLKDEHASLMEQYKSLMEEYNDSRGSLRKKKHDIDVLKDNIKTYEELKYSSEINSAKKLKMIEKQIKEARSSIKQEERVAEKALEKTEAKKMEIAGVKKKIIFIKNKYENLVKDNSEELKKLKKERAILEKKIKELNGALEKSELEEYRTMKNRFNDPISFINSRKCGGCSVDIPAMDYEAARVGGIVKCESCGRILYYQRKK